MTRTRRDRAVRWPDEVPVLVADDLTWEWTSGVRRDLFGWLEITFDPDELVRTPAQDEAKRVLCEVITERFEKQVRSLWVFLEFAKKHQAPALAWQAACWNEMLARLGYSVPRKSRRDPGAAWELGGTV